MRIKKKHTYTHNRQIWRLLPTESGKLIIEERDSETKEVFFNCIESESGRTIFKNLQFDEKFWIGIETIHIDVIIFNRFLKPDMPQHRGIIAFDIKSQKILWENSEYTFLFIKDEKLYCYLQKFEGRKYIAANYITGEVIEEHDDPVYINLLREEAAGEKSYNGFFFPERFFSGENINSSAGRVLNEYKENNVVIGSIEYVLYYELILMSTFEPGKSGLLDNIFKAIDIESGKVIFEEILTADAKVPVPDSFFVIDKILYLLLGKTKLLVCTIIN